MVRNRFSSRKNNLKDFLLRNKYSPHEEVPLSSLEDIKDSEKIEDSSDNDKDNGN